MEGEGILTKYSPIKRKITITIVNNIK
ncbi:uncharacterized protein METZ01_LOCUS333702 [marine metagenome]|uniref:Uncharacterized protein n=1 Tax=marine metagenome TaxID=408172 RepID=A0A382Q7C1_9ZZZZ